MEQLFLVPACSDVSIENIKLTLNQKVDLVAKCYENDINIDELMKDIDLSILSSVNIWGTDDNKKDVWNNLNTGDKVLYYSKDENDVRKFTHYGKVVAKTHSKELSKIMWDNEKFEYIHICADVQFVDIDKSVLFNYFNYNMDKVQGFMRVAQDRIINATPISESLDEIIEYLQIDDTYVITNNLPDKNTTSSDNKTENQVSKRSYSNRKQLFEDTINNIMNGSIIISNKQDEKPPKNYNKNKNSRSKSTAVNTNFPELNALRGALGELGEVIVFKMEKERLISEGRNDLADKIDIVSKKSNTYGYDVLSFNTDGSERYIEVKTTTKGKEEPFDITYREIETSDSVMDSNDYYLYRIYNLRFDNFNYDYYMVKGSLTKALKLKPLVYKAYIE